MKRSLFLFSFLIFLALVFGNSSERAFTSEQSKACCQKFQVITEGGEPVSGCIIRIKGTDLSCITGDDGTCEICFTVDTQYTAVASCPGQLNGSTVFSPCVQDLVTIVVN
jgi:hypothetical protein